MIRCSLICSLESSFSSKKSICFGGSADIDTESSAALDAGASAGIVYVSVEDAVGAGTASVSLEDVAATGGAASADDAGAVETAETGFV